MNIAISMAIRLSASAEFYILFLYTAELFPTHVRSLSLGICNFIGRLGGIVA